MKKIKKLLALTVFIIIGCLVLFMMKSYSKEGGALYVDIVKDAGQEKVKVWSDKENKKYVFLPSYADLGNVYFQLEPSERLTIDGIKAYDGMNCAGFEIGKTYIITYDIGKREHFGEIVFLKSSNVATMFIDTASGTMDYVHSQKGNEETCEIAIYDTFGNLNYDRGNNSINGRGNATWEYFDKKPYSIALAEEADLLEMGAASEWILLANAADPALIRNKLAFEFAHDLRLDYSPESRWIDLYINNEYRGLYLLCERNEVEEQRVNISDEKGVLVSLEREDRLIKQGYPYIKTDAEITARIHYPKDSSNENILKISNKLQMAEDRILSNDESCELANIIDVDSWVKKYLIEEIFLSCDACCLSQYFYYEGEGKIYAGPVWDYDYSLGNYVSWQCVNPDGLYAKRDKATTSMETPWFAALYENEAFYQEVTKLYANECVQLIDELISRGIKFQTKLVEKAALQNNIRWNVSQNEDHAQNIVTFFEKRKEFLTSIWLDGISYHEIRMDPVFDDFYGYFSVFRGECLKEIPLLEDKPNYRFMGWFYEGTDNAFDISEPIYSDTNIYAKWERKFSAEDTIKKSMRLFPLMIAMGIGGWLYIFDLRRMRKGG